METTPTARLHAVVADWAKKEGLELVKVGISLHLTCKSPEPKRLLGRHGKSTSRYKLTDEDWEMVLSLPYKRKEHRDFMVALRKRGDQTIHEDDLGIAHFRDERHCAEVINLTLRYHSSFRLTSKDARWRGEAYGPWWLGKIDL